MIPNATVAEQVPATPMAVSPRKAVTYLDVGHDVIYQLLRQGRLAR